MPADQPLHSTPAERQQWVEQQRQAAVATARRGHANTAHLSDAWEQRRWTSRLIHRLGAYAASADAAVCAAMMVLVWLFVGFLTGFPSWSPDGKWIAFENQVGEDDFLMLSPSSGGEAKQLTTGPGKSWPHTWSGDGDKIAFARLHDGVWNIYWYSISSKTETLLTNYTKLNAFVRYPAWAPQGNQIVYEYAETTGNVWMAEFK